MIPIGVIYTTFFTVASLIPALFLILQGLFLISIKDKSKASLHLGIVFLMYCSIPISYLVQSSWYDPLAAYNRWIAAYVSLPSTLHVILFFMCYPEIRRPKLIKYLFVVGWIILVIGWFTFIFSTINSGEIYDFSSHAWTLDAFKPQELVAKFIVLGVLFIAIVGIWDTVITKTFERWVALGILIGFLICTIIPSIANVLSRDGKMERGIFMTIYDIFTVSGMFIIFILFINNTRDKTSFMAKIVGVSLVTFFLVLQVISNYSLSDKEEAFDIINQREAELIAEGGYKNPELKYEVTYSIQEDKLEQVIEDKSDEINFEHYKMRAYNFYIISEILNLNEYDTIKNQMFYILKDTKPEFIGYKESLLNFINSYSGSNLKQDVIEYIGKLQSDLLPLRIVLQRTPEDQIGNTIAKSLEKSPERLKPFLEAIRKFSQTNFGKPNFKENIIQYIAEMKPPETRYYLADVTGKKHYVSYFCVNFSEKKVYEVGFDYLYYRKYIHKTALKFVLIILAVVAFVIFGFRVFFYKALVLPLNELLKGLMEVNKGDLDIKLPVFVEDEIGYLAKSFNRMVRSIRAAKMRLQQYADQLELKVQERTKELNTTLEEVQKLKVQQDGDYFLTSLLIRPLGKNLNRSDKVSVKYFVAQKKKFEFRKWNEELGGDICIADTIHLRGKRFTVFLNADAMGKSIQGAGGALVLGSVFRSIIDRTSIERPVQNLYPEKWLKNSFIELQKIFESFEGSMLISMVMGVVEEDNGFMYYINAEHPYTILYRDNKAEFLENEIMFWKLGVIEGTDRSLYVKTFSLKNGDVLIAGSDGRDDILIGMETNGGRILNEDETSILKRVEEGEGDLERIYNRIMETGELTDDLSLLRIEYKNENLNGNKVVTEKEIQLLKEAKIVYDKNNTQEAIRLLESVYTINPINDKVLKSLTKIYFKQKNYSKAIFYAEQYINLDPGENKLLFMISYSYRKLGKLQESVEVGERIRIRNPDFTKNLVNLVEVYVQMENFERARLLTEDAIKVEPSNDKLLKLKKDISYHYN
ncbi:MAG: SpoIIE family protein phosphatase [Leptospiraceae bacterium]|nr:SpoIIE family protein phosphatase [Leptospiraceae bacterium]MCP5494190.1 SpoIIE family protein phosphatase [Leptospiraceae bacterium]